VTARTGDEGLAFEYLPIGAREHKPRSTGLTVVIDGMDAGFLSVGEIEALRDGAASYVDYAKLGWLVPRLVPKALLRDKIAAYHRVGVKVLLGGMALEYALLHGKAGPLLDDCAALGIDALEVSASAAFVPLARQRRLVGEVRGRGLEVFVELGRKGAAQDPSAADVVRHLECFGDLGVERFVVESERVASLEARGVLEAFLEDLARSEAASAVIELPYGVSFPQLVPVASRVFGVLGPDANVANVDVRHVLALETVRTGTCFGGLFGLVPVEERRVPVE
jgi:phosphosulfolactate synthase